MHQPIQDRLTAELLTTISELRKERTELNASLRWAYENSDKHRAELKLAQAEVERLTIALEATIS